MTRVLASDQVKKGSDGLKPLFPPSHSPMLTNLDTAAPYIPSAEEQSRQQAEQPAIGYDEQQTEAQRRKAVDDLGYGDTR